MGKFGSELSDFIKEALENEKYGESLICIDKKTYTFRLSLPRLSKSTIGTDSVKILKDWNLKKGRKLKNIEDFSNAKQGIKMAFKKSRYIEKIYTNKTSVHYRIRTDGEVNAMLKRKKKNKNLQNDASSGYGSNESPCNVDSHCVSGCDEQMSCTIDSPENDCGEMLLEDVFAASADSKSRAEFEKSWKEIENWVDQIQDDKSVDQNVLLNQLNRPSSVTSSGYGSIDFPCNADPHYIIDYDEPMCSNIELPENDSQETLLDVAIADYDPSVEFIKMWKENINQMGCLDQNGLVGNNSKVVPLYEIIEMKQESDGIMVQCEPSSKELKPYIPVGAAFLSDILGVVANKNLLKLLEICYVKHINLLNGCLQLFLSLKNPAEEHIEYTKQYLGRGEGYILCGTDHFIYCCNC